MTEYVNFSVRMKKEFRYRLRQIAAAKDMAIAEFIMQAIQEKINRDQKQEGSNDEG